MNAAKDRLSRIELKKSGLEAPMGEVQNGFAVPLSLLVLVAERVLLVSEGFELWLRAGTVRMRPWVLEVASSVRRCIASDGPTASPLSVSG